MKHTTRSLLLLASILSVQCTKSFEGSYDSPDTVEVLTDRWNETDSRKTAEKMVAGMLDKPWLQNVTYAKEGKKPIVVVDEIENRTDEHIDTKTLTEYIRDELINSGRVRFLDKGAREKIADELKYQNESGAVAQDKAMRQGRQAGAQYFLGGNLSSNVQSQGGHKTVTYQTNLILTNLESSEIVWSEKYLIKKRLKKSGSSW
jgi:penicillin-binding protein activator